jgi:S-formylglutathione hydrolase FrmB
MSTRNPPNPVVLSASNIPRSVILSAAAAREARRCGVEGPLPPSATRFHNRISRRLQWFLVLCLPLIASIAAQAQGRMDCAALNSRVLKQPVHYCVLLPDDYSATLKEHSAPYPALYFLHGLGQNEQALFKSGGWDLIEDLRQQHKIGQYLIVAPEGKNSFFINSADGRVRYSDFFIREFIPYIETKYAISKTRVGRAITGLSMGGYGALRFAFAYPEMFSSVSAQSAALMTESPQELNSALQSRTQLGQLLGSTFGDPINIPHWKQNDPFMLARTNKAAVAKLAIYFNCGKEDDFDFEIGAEALHRLLLSEGIKHEFHLYPGDHSPEYFLAHLEETLEFHSKVFAKGH